VRSKPKVLFPSLSRDEGEALRPRFWQSFGDLSRMITRHPGSREERNPSAGGTQKGCSHPARWKNGSQGPSLRPQVPPERVYCQGAIDRIGIKRCGRVTGATAFHHLYSHRRLMTPSPLTSFIKHVLWILNLERLRYLISDLRSPVQLWHPSAFLTCGSFVWTGGVLLYYVRWTVTGTFLFLSEKCSGSASLFASLRRLGEGEPATRGGVVLVVGGRGPEKLPVDF
jgi:hypothetical protein